jgi:teichoic acid transport system permease protein
MHYLGGLWQFLNPASQLITYWLVFGIGLKGSSTLGDYPFFIWLISGLIPWFFINSVILEGSMSVLTQVNIVSRMKFPMSVLPSIKLVSNSFAFIIMLVLLFATLMIYNINAGKYYLQLPYYLFACYIFLFALTLLFSTITVLIRDFQQVLHSIMRMLFFFAPIIWDPTTFSPVFNTVLKLNPIYYLIEGFRATFLGEAWFYEDHIYTIYFWSVTLLLLIVGCILHVSMRKKFVDYV